MFGSVVPLNCTFGTIIAVVVVALAKETCLILPEVGLVVEVEVQWATVMVFWGAMTATDFDTGEVEQLAIGSQRNSFQDHGTFSWALQALGAVNIKRISKQISGIVRCSNLRLATCCC